METMRQKINSIDKTPKVPIFIYGKQYLQIKAWAMGFQLSTADFVELWVHAVNTGTQKDFYGKVKKVA